MLYIKVPLWYMSALWRDCLRTIKNGDQSTKKELLQKAQSTWKSSFANGFLKGKEKLGFYFSA